ncbi:hypothetical protein BS333_15190 [Vibrio azureus]|uniref:Uncharacterized protein n=1 Tax=Vibrio azureus NBRC 104587 TaxID=1219077 RepID=U3A9H7_9VIBR|nr:hypothetical protein [Vibrio azureus]AUI87745.1 hypothetical protein BS333_15190 [Vibrio azureus]GAD76601.1 hypothetical protein VAZ01S_048_00080 [Vibrio azureus NBRC 104587]
MLVKKGLIAAMLVGAFSVHANDLQDKSDLQDVKDTIGDIQESIAQSQDTMRFERSVSPPFNTPEPKYNKDKPSHSYFVLEKYDIYSSAEGERTVQAFITNNSFSGVKLKPSQIKAYFGGQNYVSPISIDQEGSFAQGESKSVTLHFGQHDVPVMGLITRSY